MTLRSAPEKPVYLRLREEIAAGILTGRFAEGSPLPSVRAFASDQGANPLTVAKAYQGFQNEGLITVKRGIGMFVATGARDKLKAIERDKFLAEEWPQMLDRIAQLGLDPDSLLRARATA